MASWRRTHLHDAIRCSAGGAAGGGGPGIGPMETERLGRRSSTPLPLAAHAQELGIFGRKITIPSRPVSLEGAQSARLVPPRAGAPLEGSHQAALRHPSIGDRGDIVAYLTVVRCVEGPVALRRAAAGTARLGFGPEEVRELVAVVERALELVKARAASAPRRPEGPERASKKPVDLSVGSETDSGLGYRLRITGPSA